MLTLKRILAGIMVIVSGAAGLMLVLPLLNVVSLRLLQAGSLEGPGQTQALKTLIGIPLALGLGAAWLTLALFVSEYYYEGVKRNQLGPRFILITAWQLLAVPVVVMVHQIALPMGMIFSDWLLFSAGLYLGSMALYVYYGTRSQKAPSKRLV